MKDTYIGNNGKIFIQIAKNLKSESESLMFVNINDIRSISYINHEESWVSGGGTVRTVLEKPKVKLEMDNGLWITMEYEDFEKYLGPYVSFCE